MLIKFLCILQCDNSNQNLLIVFYIVGSFLICILKLSSLYIGEWIIKYRSRSLRIQIKLSQQPHFVLLLLFKTQDAWNTFSLSNSKRKYNIYTSIIILFK